MSQDANTVSDSTPDAPTIALARLGKVSGAGDQVNDADWVDVHFNPSTLQLQVSNELKDQPNLERKQYIAKTSAKLTMDIQFDTTDSGMDVTQTTRKVQAFIAPPLPEDQQARRQVPPPLVLFEWGTLAFKGIVESYKETIDFFSSDGVPLRANVNLTLSRLDQVFDPAGESNPADDGQSSEGTLFDLPPTSASQAADETKEPGSSRAIAVANGLESLRFGDGSGVTVGSGVTLKAAAAFSAGGGAGVSLDAGMSSGIGLGETTGATAGVDVDVGVGIAAQAGLSATEGAFASLQSSKPLPTSFRVNPEDILPVSYGAGFATEAGAKFQLGGQAAISGSVGLTADVGTRTKLSFDED